MKLVLLRHGESLWNKENRFTGWTDIDLSAKGIREAKEAGALLKKNDYMFDLAYTSYLIRAIHTLHIVLKILKADIPVEKSWRLNERHYGALQGLNKAETAKRYGKEQVHTWRRSYDIQPPPLKKSDRRWSGHETLYKKINLPLTESLKDTVKRVIPYWRNKIAPQLKSRKRIIISAHGNSLRALIKYIDNIPDKDIPNLEIPTGKPLVYEFDNSLKPKRHFYLE